jgi:hypothetical protein
MKRFFTLAAAALLSSTFTASSFAGWGENGQYGNPIGPVVGTSSTPSTNPASAPISTPFDPNGNLGSVPGSIQDKLNQLPPGGSYGQLGGYNPNSPIFKPGMPAGPIMPSSTGMPSNMGMPSNGGVFLPGMQRPAPQTYPSNPMTSYPQYPQQNPQPQVQTYPMPYPQQYPQQYPQYPSQMSTGYPKPTGYPQANGYPQVPSYPHSQGYPQTTSYPSNYPQTTSYPPAQMYPQINSYPQYPQQHYPTTGSYGGQPTSSWGGYGQGSASYGPKTCGR